jgi:hypothetical protein
VVVILWHGDSDTTLQTLILDDFRPFSAAEHISGATDAINQIIDAVSICMNFSVFAHLLSII